ncbi:MAG: hypothetical protein AAGA55_08620 [Planctomycetota bacterium]
MPADGLFDFEARIYPEAMPADPPPDEPVQPLSIESFDDVVVRGGLFTLELGLAQAVLDAHAAGQPIYLELGVRVGTGKVGYTTLLPRTRVRPTPFASFADQPVATLQSAYDAGPTVTTLPGVRLSFLGDGETLFTTPFYVNRPGADSTTDADLSLVPGDDGGRLTLRNGEDRLLNLAPDPDGSGGFLSIGRGDGTGGVIMDGNYESTGSPRLTLIGSGSTSVIDASVSGSASVDLPANAIDAAEIFDEPGIATDRATPNVTLPHLGDLQIAATRAITVPAGGFILVTGSLETLITGSPTGIADAGMSVRIDYGISTTGNSIANGMDYTYIFETPPWSGASVDEPFMLGNTLPFTDVIEVGQATTLTISAVARFTSLNSPEPTCTVRDVNINLLYVPTAYGTVGLRQGAGVPDHLMPETRPGIRDVLAEYDAERSRYRWEQAEQQRAMAERIKELERQVQRLSDRE